MTVFFDARETLDHEARQAILLSRLRNLVARAKAGSEFWRERLKGIEASDLASLAGLAGLPVLPKQELLHLHEEFPPLGGIATGNARDFARYFLSPGPIVDPEGGEPDPWRGARALFAAGVRPGHLVHNCFAYHMTPGAWLVDGAARRIGSSVFPGGTGNSEQQLLAMERLKPEVYAGTPSFLRILMEKAEAAGGIGPSWKHAVVAGEALPDSLRAWFHDAGIETVLQFYGTADLGMVAYESVAGEGMIVDEDVYVEIVRPGTGEAVPEGEVGEVVVTSFNRRYPLIRFATGDLSSIKPGRSACGRTNVRISGWLGRSAPGVKIKGMFVYPRQIQNVVDRIAEIGRARLVVTGEMAKDRATLYCEVDASLLKEGTGLAQLGQRIQSVVQGSVRLNCDIEFVPGGHLAPDDIVIEDRRTVSVA